MTVTSLQVNRPVWTCRSVKFPTFVRIWSKPFGTTITCTSKHSDRFCIDLQSAKCGTLGRSCENQICSYPIPNIFGTNSINSNTNVRWYSTLCGYLAEFCGEQISGAHVTLMVYLCPEIRHKNVSIQLWVASRFFSREICLSTLFSVIWLYLQLNIFI